MRAEENIAEISNAAAALQARLSRVQEEIANVCGRRQTMPPAQFLRTLIEIRRARDGHFPSRLFADAAWDMLLDLALASCTGERISVSSLCIAAAVPPTTALRHIALMVREGHFVRERDPADGRRIYIALSQASRDSMMLWLRETQQRLQERHAD